ncbi:hypothetical protein [Mangrovibrevibacter kandeliae]|uniref:hypothetical protein n=1 Tax=Mangrovibrevibacter kandeliae TaxID=2968473 RepID=UPI0021191FD8|nr:hypothetical protein [Aurantimonas sp. CSK15Z-1]MCQ8781731.1 hypothetical protein [Aurantimonas sp. CSK15Z-1]
MALRTLISPGRIIISKPGYDASPSLQEHLKVFDSNWNVSGTIVDAGFYYDPAPQTGTNNGVPTTNVSSPHQIVTSMPVLGPAEFQPFVRIMIRGGDFYYYDGSWKTKNVTQVAMDYMTLSNFISYTPGLLTVQRFHSYNNIYEVQDLFWMILAI